MDTTPRARDARGTATESRRTLRPSGSGYRVDNPTCHRSNEPRESLKGITMSACPSPDCLSVSSAGHTGDSLSELLASELEDPSSAHSAGLPPESSPCLSARRRQRLQGSTSRPL